MELQLHHLQTLLAAGPGGRTDRMEHACNFHIADLSNLVYDAEPPRHFCYCIS